MHKHFVATGAFLGAVAVGLGAFGAHGLKQVVPPETVNTFETGVRYQMYHSLALVLVASLADKLPASLVKWSGISFVTGIVLFSGSLYVLTVLKATEQVGLSKIGLITPFGGLFFILGWVLFFAAAVRKKS